MIPRLALIGVTGYGAVHLAQFVRLHEAGRARLVAATVINPAEAAEACATLGRLEGEVFGDYRRMLSALRGRIDLCGVPTGIAWHAPMACDALDAGTNVYVEKPLAGCVADADRIIAAADAASRFVAVGYQDMYQPENLAMKRRLLAGAIGDVRRMAVIGLWPRPLSYYRRNNWAGRLRDAQGWVRDSPVNNALAHYLNLALFVGGTRFDAPLTPVGVAGTLWRANDIESFDTVAVRFATAEGVDVAFYATHATARQRDVELRIEGTGGMVAWTPERGWCIESRSAAAEAPAPVTAQNRREAPYGAAVARVSQSDAWVYTPRMARAHTLAVELLHDTLPIAPAPRDRVERRAAGKDDEIVVIRGIEEEWEQHWRTNSLP